MRRKLFSSSTTTRRKLFSTSNTVRRRLFSEEPEPLDYEWVPKLKSECPSCGWIGPDEDGVCPNCGSPYHSTGYCCEECQEEVEERDDDETGEVLKKFSNRTVSRELVERTFSERGIDMTIDQLVNSGYASEGELGQLCFSERPDLTRKLFSKLVISITKELDLDPIKPSSEVIDDYLSSSLPSKSIVLLKKAHCLGQPTIGCESDNFIKDSGILKDLKIEFGNEPISLSKFKTILGDRYNDAPTSLFDDLQRGGMIRIIGRNVELC